MNKTIKAIIEYFFPSILIITKVEDAETVKTIKSLQYKIDYLNKQVKKSSSKLTIALNDAMFFAKEATELETKLLKLEDEFSDNILPTTGMSFDKTVSNIKGMSSRARTTLLFRIVQILTTKEKQTLSNYVNYEKVNNDEEYVQGANSNN
jgi:hypothetical protein